MASTNAPVSTERTPDGAVIYQTNGNDGTNDLVIAGRVRAVFDGIADGVIISDAQGNLLEWNPAALHVHGFKSVDEVRRHLTHFEKMFVMSHVEGGPIIPLPEWPLAKALRREEVKSYELVVHRTDTGQTWNISYDAVWVRSVVDGQETDQIVLTIRDMTAWRQAEKAREESRLYVRGLIESLPQLVWTCRSDGTCDYLSPQWVAYTGVSVAEHLNYGWLNAVHPDDREAALTAWKLAAGSGQTLDVEFRIQRHDGAFRWFKTRAVPMRDSGGAITRWIGTNTDIHDARIAIESKSILAAIVEHSDDAIIGKTLEGVITSWNRSAERLFEYKAEEVIGRSVSLLLPPGGMEQEQRILDGVRSGRGVDHFESKRLTKSGKILAVSLTASPVRDGAGRIVGASTIARDITKDKQAEEALKQSEARFRRLAEAMPQIVWSTSRDGKNTYLNKRWTEITGLKEPDSRPNPTVVHPEDAVAVRAGFDQSRLAGRPHEHEFRLRHKDGGPYRWFLARSVPIVDADGEITEWFGTSTDIDDLKRAEKKARENEARLLGVLNGAVEGIITINEHGTIESVNHAVVKTFGYSVEELVGRNVSMLMPAPNTESHDSFLASYHQTGDRKIVGIGREVMGRRKDGSTFPVDLSISEVVFGTERIFTGIIRDISARKSAEERSRVQQAELAHLERVRTMGQMAAGLAHELNQPLGAIANYASACRAMIEGKNGKANRINEALEEIQSQSLRAGKIIERLRGFVKKQQPRSRAVAPNDLVEETIRLLSYEFRKERVHPQVELADDLPTVLADHVQIGQVLVNMIRNALDAMQDCDPGKRSLRVTTQPSEGGMVRIAVTDNGEGVSQENLPRIFDAFFTTKPGGLGVGLALCRTIVEDHGGQLTAEPNPTGGMTFAFTLTPSTKVAERAKG